MLSEADPRAFARNVGNRFRGRDAEVIAVKGDSYRLADLGRVPATNTTEY